MGLINPKWWTDTAGDDGDDDRTGEPFRDQVTEDIVPKVMRDFAYEINAGHVQALNGHVPYFANEPARDSVLTAPAAGQLALVGNVLTRWDGDEWLDVVFSGGSSIGISADPGNDITPGSDGGVLFDHNPEAEGFAPLPAHVPRFATTVDRDDAITAPAAGMMAVTAGHLEQHDGTNWKVLPKGLVAYAEVTANQLGFAADTNAALAGVTITAPTITGHRYRLTVRCSLVLTAASSGVLWGMESTTEMAIDTTYMTGGNAAILNAHRIFVGTGGSHTYHAVIRPIGTTAYLEATPTRPTFISLEHLGTL